jgi:hypothetical protein
MLSTINFAQYTSTGLACQKKPPGEVIRKSLFFSNLGFAAANFLLGWRGFDPQPPSLGFMGDAKEFLHSGI